MATRLLKNLCLPGIYFSNHFYNPLTQQSKERCILSLSKTINIHLKCFPNSLKWKHHLHGLLHPHNPRTNCRLRRHPGPMGTSPRAACSCRALASCNTYLTGTGLRALELHAVLQIHLTEHSTDPSLTQGLGKYMRGPRSRKPSSDSNPPTPPLPPYPPPGPAALLPISPGLGSGY